MVRHNHCAMQQGAVFVAVALTLVMITTSFPLNTPSASVNIINYVNQSVLVHCQSKDSDLGERPVDPGMMYFFHFHPNIFGLTLYWCDYFWMTHTQKFDVWKGTYYDNRPTCSVSGPCCIYKIAPDGFYFSLDSADKQATTWSFLKKWLNKPP